MENERIHGTELERGKQIYIGRKGSKCRYGCGRRVSKSGNSCLHNCTSVVAHGSIILPPFFIIIINFFITFDHLSYLKYLFKYVILEVIFELYLVIK
jgi:hypothetical protein